ncbi:MAG: formate dehydrogenase subunit gamma [Gemmatimonadota bacterium]
MEGRSERYGGGVEAADRGARAAAAAWDERVHRFSVLERALHWIMAAAGIVCILTGLGWYTQGFHFLLTWFGGGEWARWIHSVSGIVTTVCAVWLIGVLWFRHVFRFIPEDWRWLKISGGYLRRHTHPPAGRASKARRPGSNGEIPPQGFFNGGQKLWAILAVILAVLFLGSGLVIWSPELFHDFLGLQPFSVPVMRAMYIIHDAAFLVFAPMVLFHIYLSSALNPGTFEGMSGGDVSRLWALHHHPLWYREVAGEDRLGEE